jgi:hypothetical protein
LRLGKVAGRGRQEKGGRARPAVAIPAVVCRRIERRLDDYIKKRITRAEERAKREKERLERGLKPLKPLKREHALPQRAVRSPDRALRATIREALACFWAAPVLLEGLYLDEDAVQPVPDATIRATWHTLASKARGAAELCAEVDAELTIRGKKWLLERAMVRHVLPDHPEIARDPSQPLKPEVLALIAERAAQEAANYRARGGERRNLAPEHFRWKLARAIEARCGEGSAGFGWRWETDPEEGLGLLFHTLWELRPWLPGLADATPRELYDAFLQGRKRLGRKRRKRSTRQ